MYECEIWYIFLICFFKNVNFLHSIILIFFEMSIQIIKFRHFYFLSLCIFLQLKHVLFCFLVLPPPTRKLLLIIKFFIFGYGLFCFSFQFLSIFIIFYEPHFFLFQKLFFYIVNDYNNEIKWITKDWRSNTKKWFFVLPIVFGNFGQKTIWHRQILLDCCMWHVPV